MLTITEIIKNFSFLEDWEERYHYLIELGQKLPPYPDIFKDNKHLVSGCISRVWIFSNQRNTNGQKGDPILDLQGDSDSYFIKGLVYIVLSLYSGKKTSEILEINTEKILTQLNLEENLTLQRANGLRVIIARIKTEARLNTFLNQKITF